MRRYPVTLAWAALLWAAGCDGYNDPVVNDGRRLTAADISSKSVWRATSATMGDPEQAIDGKLNTAAVGPAGVGAELMIDLGKPCLFNRVSVDHGTSDEELYPRQLALQTSLDGRTFYTRKVVLGTRRITNLTIITPTLARYVRLLVQKAGAGSWRIAEIYLQ